MKIFVSIILLFGIWTGVVAQNSKEYASVDKIMLQVPESMTTSGDGLAAFINSRFSSNTDKSRALFIWIARNIQYDVANMYVIKSDLSTKESIVHTLKTRLGVCINFSELFNDVCAKMGITSYVVYGYTKQNGNVDVLSHAWCVALIDGVWYMFDPTWGSGYIQNSKFVKLVNNDYFKVRPEQFIQSHMPFDPMWQFLNYPITNQEFYDGKSLTNNSRLYFNYKDTLMAYLNLSETEQLVTSGRRIEANGVKNGLIYDRLQYIRREVEFYNNNKMVDKFNIAVNYYNSGVSLLNEFIQYRNKQFTPKRTDPEIKQMIDTVATSFNIALQELSEIKTAERTTLSNINQLKKSIALANENLDQHKTFVGKYLRTGKLMRKSLFYTATWMGIPIK